MPLSTAHHRKEGDWRGYFAGAWRMRRRIDDKRGGRRGAAKGEALFAADPNTGDGFLIYREALLIDYGGRRWPGHQETIWRFKKESGPQLCFSDGRSFCDMAFARYGDLWRAPLTHLCGDDTYEGEISITDRNTWRLIWRVTGPRKGYTLDTEYRRVGDNNRARRCKRGEPKAGCADEKFGGRRR